MTTIRPDPAARPAAHGDTLRDWATIWASEAAALACDREMQEAWHRAATCGEALLREIRPPGPDAPARTPSAGAAPVDGELADLRRRIGELERRLAERGG